jgi:hypothetical protein
VDTATIKKLRKNERMASQEGRNIIFRYFIGDSDHVDKSDYREMKKAYQDTVVGFLPLSEYGMKPLVVPGESIVFHRLPMHRFDIVGKYNPSIINSNIGQALENKYTESLFWNEYSPGVMPETVLLEKLIGKNDSAETIVQKFNAKFPQGWVLKGVWDLGSEKEIITDKTQVSKEVDAYLNSDFESYKVEKEKEFSNENAAPEYLLSALKKHPNYKGWKIHSMLKNLSLSILQGKVDIDREFRVEVIAGKVLGGKSTIDRWWYTYFYGNKMDEYIEPTKQQIRMVEEFAQNAVNKLPEQLRNMTFGMDIALLKNGGAVMIESNPGGNSNFLFEEERESVLALRKRLEKFPELVKSGRINLGLSPREQMSYLRKQLDKWGVSIQRTYPGMKFMEDRIIDKEFTELRPNPEFYQVPKQSTDRRLPEKQVESKSSSKKIMSCQKIYSL